MPAPSRPAIATRRSSASTQRTPTTPTIAASEPAQHVRKPTIAAACCVCGTVLKVPLQGAFKCAVCETTTDREFLPTQVEPPTQAELERVRGDALVKRTREIFGLRSAALPGRPLYKLHARVYEAILRHPLAAQELLAALRAIIFRPPQPLPAPTAAILLACPLLAAPHPSVALSFDERVDLLGRLAGAIANMDNAGHHALVTLWKRSLSRNELLARIDTATTLLSSLVTSGKLPWRFRAAARVIALYRNVAPDIPPDRFFVLALEASGPAQLARDFELWQARATDGFNFCSYPFLIPLSQKLAILRYEARRDAEALARRAMWARSSAGSTEAPLVSLTIRRDHLVNDSLHGIAKNLEHLRKDIRVRFVDANGRSEDGIDAGGIRREWFTLLVSELFGAYDLWETDEDSGLCWLNPLTSADSDELQLVGVVLGLAAKHGTPIDVPLAPAVYRKLLNRPLGLADLRIWRPALARGLDQLLAFEGDVEATFCRTFVYETESCGQLFRAALKPDGEQIAVTRENRAEYVELYVQYTFEAARKQFASFKAGFMHVLRGNALTLFSPEELELLVRGSDAPIDLAQLKLNTRFRGLDEDEIRLFWRWMERSDDARRRDFVRFVTGTGRLPATGHLALSVHASGDDQTRLPISHTCFNQLVMPKYRCVRRIVRV